MAPKKKTSSEQDRKQVKRRTLPKAAEPFKFKPGQSGNPGGRPKRKKITDALIDALEVVIKSGNKTAAEAIALAMVRKAIKGDVKAATFIGDRTEGKPMQAVKIEGGLTISDDERRKRISELLTRANSKA
jgi:hypothetical protein